MDQTNYNNIKEYIYQFAESRGDDGKAKASSGFLFKEIKPAKLVEAFENSLCLFYEPSNSSSSKNCIPYYVNAENGITEPLLPIIQVVLNEIYSELSIDLGTLSLNSLTKRVVTQLISKEIPESFDESSRRYVKPKDPRYYLSLQGLNKKPKRLLRLAPSHWIRFKNGIFNAETKQLLTDKELKQAESYNFTKGFPFDYIPLHACNLLQLSAINRITLNWADNDEEHQLFIKQLAFAATEGNNKGTCIMLKSNGGGGKSTFMTILQESVRIATQNADGAIIECGLFNLDNDTKIVQLSQLTHLIVGEGVPANAKLSDDALARMNNITDSNESRSVGFMINVKYQSSRPVSSKALILQTINSNDSLVESDKLLVFPWTNRNFGYEDNKFYLHETMNNPDLDKRMEFYQTWVCWILNTVDYFKTFTKPTMTVQSIQHSIPSDDPVFEYVKHLNDYGVLESEILPLRLLYKAYAMWHKENIGPTPLRAITFINSFTEHLRPLGFVIRNDYESNKLGGIKRSDNRYETKNLKSYQFSNKALSQLLPELHGAKLTYLTKEEMLINPDNVVSNQDIIAFENGAVDSTILTSLRKLNIFNYIREGKESDVPNFAIHDKYFDIIPD